MNGSTYDLPMSAENGDVKIRRYANPMKPTLAHEAVHYIEIPDYEALNAKFDAFAAAAGKDYLEKRDIKKPRFMTEFTELARAKNALGKLPDYRTASENFKKFGLKTYIERPWKVFLLM